MAWGNFIEGYRPEVGPVEASSARELNAPFEIAKQNRYRKELSDVLRAVEASDTDKETRALREELARLKEMRAEILRGSGATQEAENRAQEVAMPPQTEGGEIPLFASGNPNMQGYTPNYQGADRNTKGMEDRGIPIFASDTPNMQGYTPNYQGANRNTKGMEDRGIPLFGGNTNLNRGIGKWR